MSLEEESDGMEHVTLRVPTQLLEQVDDVYEKRGFASRSDFLRTAIRDAAYPPTVLPEETLADIEESTGQLRDGEFVSLDE